MAASDQKVARGQPDEGGVDVRLLSRILAAQNLFFALPAGTSIADFYVNLLSSIPGAGACRVCLADSFAQEGTWQDEACSECALLRRSDGKGPTVPRHFSCGLTGGTGCHVVALETVSYRFGFFAFRLDRTGLLERYKTLVSNLGMSVALALENRMQRGQLQEARRVLERRVRERTEELQRTNVQLRKEIEERAEAERKLADSQEQYRFLFETMAQGVIILDADGTIADANRAASDILATPREQLLGQSSSYPGRTLVRQDGSPLHPDELPSSVALRTGKPVSEQLVGVCLPEPGIRRWLLAGSAPKLRDGESHPYLTVATFTDITERKQAEEALRASEERYRSLVQKLQTAVMVHAPDSRILTCNPIAADILGLTEDELLGKPVAEPTWRFTREDGSQMPPEEYPLNRVLETGRPVRNMVVGLRRPNDEREAWFIVDVSPVRDRDGRLTEVISTFSDVTEWREAVEKLNHLAAIVESSGDAIIGETLEGRILSWNEGAEQIYGYAANEVLGSPTSVLVPPDRRDELSEILTKLRAGETVPYFDTVRLRKDGRAIHVSLTVSPIRDAAGRIAGASSIARDITARRRIEEEVRRLNQELEQRVAERTAQLEEANRELEAFAYTVSHDLRAPLRHIDGFLGLLQRHVGDALDGRGQRHVENISQAAWRMGQLIDDLLAFSRMGRAEMSLAPVELGPLVKDVVGELAPEAAGRDVRWRIAELPVVTGDGATLRVVLVNLLANALKFTQTRNTAEIEVGWKPGSRGEVAVFVRDNGVGFDPAHAGKLFGVFQRLHRAEEFEGTGIGLATVHRIVARHGGRAWAQGAVNEGATFYFTLKRDHGEG